MGLFDIVATSGKSDAEWGVERVLGNGGLCNNPKYTLIVFSMFRVFCRYNWNFRNLKSKREKISKLEICTRYKGKSEIYQNRI